MNSGLLNKVAEVYSRQLNVDSYGSKSINYKLVMKTRTNVKRLDGNPSVVNDEVIYTYPLSLLFRTYVPITDYCVVKIDNQFYAVDSVVKEVSRQVVKVHSIDETLINIIDD